MDLETWEYIQRNKAREDKEKLEAIAKEKFDSDMDEIERILLKFDITSKSYDPNHPYNKEQYKILMEQEEK
tara:strand:+ start:234 stop:446 length:213 start_codon:yes stop_codon:yes gene_type:complete